jgi:hypothetical protein
MEYKFNPACFMFLRKRSFVKSLQKIGCEWSHIGLGSRSLCSAVRSYVIQIHNPAYFVLFAKEKFREKPTKIGCEWSHIGLGCRSICSGVRPEMKEGKPTKWFSHSFLSNKKVQK